MPTPVTMRQRCVCSLCPGPHLSRKPGQMALPTPGGADLPGLAPVTTHLLPTKGTKPSGEASPLAPWGDRAWALGVTAEGWPQPALHSLAAEAPEAVKHTSSLFLWNWPRFPAMPGPCRTPSPGAPGWLGTYLGRACTHHTMYPGRVRAPARTLYRPLWDCCAGLGLAGMDLG